MTIWTYPCRRTSVRCRFCCTGPLSCQAAYLRSSNPVFFFSMTAAVSPGAITSPPTVDCLWSWTSMRLWFVPSRRSLPSRTFPLYTRTQHTTIISSFRTPPLQSRRLMSCGKNGLLQSTSWIGTTTSISVLPPQPSYCAGYVLVIHCRINCAYRFPQQGSDPFRLLLHRRYPEAL